MSLRVYYTILLISLLSMPAGLVAQSCSNVSLNNITNPGAYTIATINQNSGIRNGPDYGDATIYYPTNATPPYASVAIVPGFFATQSSVQEWGPFLASNGIVTIIIDTNSIFDDPGDRADALIDALETMRQENTRSASPLFGDLDITRFAVMGWSMGGGGAQLSASIDPSLKAVIGLCPWLSNPNSNDLNHSVPVLILSGQNDPTAPPNQHANVHYSLTPNTTDKMLFEIANGNHSVANDPDNAQGDIGKYGLAWLRYFLLDDDCHCPLVLQPSTATSQNVTNVICPSACLTQITLPNNPIADGTYHASMTVNSTGTVPVGGVVSLLAGQTICFDSGFSALAGSDFEAYIQSCP